MSGRDEQVGSAVPPEKGKRAAAGKGAETKRKQLLLRLDPAVHEAIAKWAVDDLRSANAQIEIIPRRALVEAGRDPRSKPMWGRGRPRKELDDEAGQADGKT